MKKLYFLFLALIFCTGLYAGVFKISYGDAGPQSMTNIQLILLSNTPPYYSLVTTGSVSPTDYSTTDSSVTFSYPDGSQQILFCCNIPTEDYTYTVHGGIYPNIKSCYTLQYNSSNDMFYIS